MKQLFARARQNGETHPWLVAFTVMLAVFMEVLDTSVANVALPHIAGNLSAGVDESTWVLTSYLVSNAIVLPAHGLVLHAVRPQAVLHDLRGHLHDQLHALRARPQSCLAGVFPHPARRRRGSVAAHLSGHLAREFPQGKARHGNGHVRRGRGHGAHHRSHPGRLAHRQL